MIGILVVKPFTTVFVMVSGTSTYSATNTASDSTVTPYEEKKRDSQIWESMDSIWILELTGKFASYALNYFSRESGHQI